MAGVGVGRQGLLHVGSAHAVRAGAEFYPLQLLHRRMEIFRGHRIPVLPERRHQTGVAQRVDQARHAARVLVDGGVGVVGKYAPTLGAGYLEAMIDVRSRLSLRESGQMKSQADALRELNQLGRIELVAELRLPRENDAQCLLLGGQPELSDKLNSPEL